MCGAGRCLRWPPFFSPHLPHPQEITPLRRRLRRSAPDVLVRLPPDPKSYLSFSPGAGESVTGDGLVRRATTNQPGKKLTIFRHPQAFADLLLPHQTPSRLVSRPEAVPSSCKRVERAEIVASSSVLHSPNNYAWCGNASSGLTSAPSAAGPVATAG